LPFSEKLKMGCVRSSFSNFHEPAMAGTESMTSSKAMPNADKEAFELGMALVILLRTPTMGVRSGLSQLAL
jgi:hypothetical protein